ncbi:MAG: tetratricopeptide repeat protein [Chitinivibrionales bacterium]|nr:tetratricopeptide repeat protein [Chitinivibrionales bacterium]MBD3356438.1 tetratricopeptide repeat protein [Chitinivibrionales bacterium]
MIRRSLLMFSVITATFSLAFPFPLRAQEAKPAGPNGGITLIIARPEGDPSNQWFGALAEVFFRFRFQPLHNCTIVPRDSLRKHVPGYGDYSRSVPTSVYRTFGEKIGATHVITQNYEATNSESIDYFVEVVQITGNDAVAELDQTFPLTAFGSVLDSSIMKTVSALSLKLDAEESRFLSMSIMSGNSESIRRLGKQIISTDEAGSEAGAEAGREMEELAARDNRMLLAHFSSYEAYAKAGKHAKAADRAKTLLTVIPSYVPLYPAICHQYLEAGNYGQVASFFEKGIRRGISTPAFYKDGARAYRQTGNYDMAAKAYKLVLRSDPDDLDAHVFFAKAGNDKKRHEEAIRHAEKALSTDPDNGEALLEKGKALLARNSVEKAETALKKAGGVLPEALEPALLLADLYAEAQKWEAAAEQYEKVIRLRPELADVYPRAALVNEKAGNPAAALSLLKKMPGDGKDEPTILRKRALLEYEHGDRANAHELLERSLTHNQSDAKVLLALAEIYKEKQDLEKATQMYERALPLATDIKLNVEAHLGKLYLSRKLPERALPLLSKVALADPRIPGINLAAGKAALMLGDSASALKYLEKERKISGGRVPEDIQKEIAHLTYQKKTPAEAAKEFKRVLDLDPANHSAYRKIALCQLRLGNVAEARTSLAEAEKLGSAKAPLYEELGNEFARNKAVETAMEQYRKSLDLSPDNASVWEKLASLQKKTDRRKELAESYMHLYRLNNTKHKGKLAEAGHLYLSIGRPEKAEKVYAAFIDSGYSDPSVNVEYGGILFSRKNYEEVIKLLTSKEMPEPGGDTVISMLGKSYFAAEKFTKAAPLLAKLAPARTTDTSLIAMTAEACDSSANFPCAIRYYDKLLALRGDNADPETGYRLGSLLEKQGMTAQAVARYEENLRRFPRDLRNYLKLAERYRKAKDTAALVRVLQKSIDHPEVPPTLRRELARQLAAQDKNEPAIIHYEHYLVDVPNDSSALLALGSLHYDQRQYKKAVDPLKKAVRFMPRHKKALFMLGHACKQTGDINGAVDAFESLVKLGNPAPEVLDHLAECYRKTENDTALINVLSMHLEHKPNDFTAQKELGMLLTEQNAHARAAALLESAVRLKPDDTELHLALARIYDIQKNAKRCIAHLHKAVTLGVNKPAVHADLAKLYEAEGNDSAAAMHFSAALALSKRKDPDLSHHIGELLEKAGLTAEAKKRYRKSIGDYPKDIRAYTRLAAIYRKAGEKQKLKELLEKGVKLAGAPPVFDRYLAEILHERNDEAGAILHYEKYVTQSPSDSSAQLALGSIYYKRKEYRKAVSPLRSASKRMPNNRECLLKLARASRKAGLLEPAIEAYEALRERDKMPSKEILGELASCYRQKKDTTNLIAILKEGATLAKRDFGLHKELGMLLLLNDRTNEGARILAHAVTLNPKDIGLHLALAGAYQTLDRPDKQIEHLERALTVKSNDAAIHFELGRLYKEQGNYKKAIEAYRTVIKIQPGHDKARFRYAELLFKDGKVKSAQKLLEKAVSQNPGVAHYHVRLADTWASLGNFAEALKALRGAMQLDPSNVEYLLRAAEMNVKLGDLDKAHAHLGTAVAEDSSCMECLSRFGSLASITGDYQGVVNALSTLFQRSRFDDTLAMYLGDAYAQLGETDKAAEVFEKIMAANPTNTEALYRLAHHYIEKDEIDKAQKARERHPVARKTGWTHLVAAEFKENGELYNEALKSFKAAAKLIPETPEPYAGMARMYLVKGNADQAIMMVGRAMAYDPENPDYFILMGNAYEEMKQYEAALSSYHEAEKRDPTNAELYFHIGRTHGRSREFDKAVAALNKGLSYDPKSPTLHMAMGHVLRAMDKPEHAIKAYEEAVRWGGNEYNDANMYIGMIYYKLIDNKNSLKYLKRYQKKGGANPRVTKLIEEIR